MFFLLYKHTDDGVFDDVPKISDHFPKIAEDFRGRPEDVSMIHQRIYVQFKRQTWSQWNHRYLFKWGYHNFTCEDIVSFLSICYHSVYHWLLYNKIWQYYFFLIPQYLGLRRVQLEAVPAPRRGNESLLKLVRKKRSLRLLASPPTRHRVQWVHLKNAKTDVRTG